MLSAELFFTADRSLQEEVEVGWMLSIGAWKPTGHCSPDFGHHSMLRCRLGHGCSHQPLALEDHRPRLPRNGETLKGRMARSLPREWAWTIFQWGSEAVAGGEEYREVMACHARRFDSMNRHRDHVEEIVGRALVPSRAMTWSGSSEKMFRGR